MTSVTRTSSENVPGRKNVIPVPIRNTKQNGFINGFIDDGSLQVEKDDGKRIIHVIPPSSD